MCEKTNNITTRAYFSKKIQLLNELESRLTNIYINSKANRQSTLTDFLRKNKFCVVIERPFNSNNLD
jgi:hypothetical protein